MIPVHPLRLLDVTPSRPGERPFVAAASGLCQIDDQLFVVADEEHTLAVFPATARTPGARHLLLRPEAVDHAPMPKAEKPDLEALCVLPDGALLALPSGSTPHRHIGALIRLERGQPVLPARLLDFRPLFERLEAETAELNLEGAAVLGDALWLAQRGNTSQPSALFELDLAAAIAGDQVPARAFRRTLPLNLGALRGVPLTPTDLYPLPDGRLLISAVCEDTSDSYRDGPCVGAAVALVRPGETVDRVEEIEPTSKVEGIIARPSSRGLLLWMVCDADDPTRPSPLLEGVLT